MGDDCCELLRCCCECGLCLGLCCLCCKDSGSNQRRDPYYQNGPTVTVTTQPVPHQQPYPGHGGPPQHSYGSPNPYPPSMPMPQPTPPGYPPNSGASYGMHPAPGPYPPTSVVPGGTPYPPAGYPPQPGFQAQPPPYDVAVSMPPIQPSPQTEAYGKQAPYNPHYQN